MALHEIVVGRMRHDGETRAYVARRCSGRRPLTRREAIRCLKRYVAREVWRALTHPLEVPEPDAGGRELRGARLMAGRTQREVASALGVSASSVSKVENGGVSARSGAFRLWASEPSFGGARGRFRARQDRRDLPAARGGRRTPRPDLTPTAVPHTVTSYIIRNSRCLHPAGACVMVGHSHEKGMRMFADHMQQSMDYECAAVICTAVEAESASLKQTFGGGWTRLRVPGDKQQYYEATFVDKHGDGQLVITCQQDMMGMAAASALATKATMLFRPRYLIMCGIAAGIRKDTG